MPGIVQTFDDVQRELTELKRELGDFGLWQDVGPGNQVVFGSTWTHYDTTTWGPVQWRLTREGRVELRGSATGGATGLTDALTGWPRDLWPRRSAAWPVAYVVGNNAAAPYIYFDVTTGKLRVGQGDVNSSAWLSLDHVSWPIG